jgi:hypothetical protein
MGRFIFGKKSGMALFLVLLFGLVWTGCSSTVKETRNEPPPPVPAPQPAPASPPPPAPAPEPAQASKHLAKYYFFDDILIPTELEYDQKKSFVYETPQFRSGVLYFSKWRLDTDSLFDFFLFHMEKDSWKMVTSYRGKESHLTFYKPEKGCTIRITESWLGKTSVEIRVGPAGVKKM